MWFLSRVFIITRCFVKMTKLKALFFPAWGLRSARFSGLSISSRWGRLRAIFSILGGFGALAAGVAPLSE
jgi:hypothetical protein